MLLNVLTPSLKIQLNCVQQGRNIRLEEISQRYRNEVVKKIQMMECVGIIFQITKSIPDKGPMISIID